MGLRSRLPFNSIIVVLLGLSGALFGCVSRDEKTEVDLVVSTYSSLSAKGGLGDFLFPAFEKRCSCRVSVIASEDANSLVSRVELDHKRGVVRSHVLLGVDLLQWPRLKQMVVKGSVEQGLSPVLSLYHPVLAATLGDKPGFVPFDFGIFAFMADREGLEGRKLPRRLKDLIRPEWKRSILLQDPRTSSPGLAFLNYTRHVLGQDQVWDFWRGMRNVWLTLTPGWSGAYELFVQGHAPLVWSYITSQAYHDSPRYRAVILDDPHPVQIEGAVLLQDTPLARQFLKFLLSEEVQSRVPTTQWMMPALKSAPLPTTFAQLPTPRRVVPAEAFIDPEGSEKLLRRWREAIQ